MEITFFNLDAFNALLRLRREQRISWRAVGLGAAIVTFVNNSNGEGWPSRKTLKAITGIDETDISRVIIELKDTKFLSVEERKGKTNIIRLTLGEITHGCLATRGKIPVGDQPPSHGRFTTKPMGDQPPKQIKEQTKNKETIPATPSKQKKAVAFNLAEAAENLIAQYADQVKPKRLDKSGSRKRFIETAIRLLAAGNSPADLSRAIRNYAATVAQTERNPDDVKFRLGFQSFFGPQNEHWRDYLDIPEATDTLPNAARPFREMLNPDADYEMPQADVDLIIAWEKEQARKDAIHA